MDIESSSGYEPRDSDHSHRALPKPRLYKGRNPRRKKKEFRNSYRTGQSSLTPFFFFCMNAKFEGGLRGPHLCVGVSTTRSSPTGQLSGCIMQSANHESFFHLRLVEIKKRHWPTSRAGGIELPTSHLAFWCLTSRGREGARLMRGRPFDTTGDEAAWPELSHHCVRCSR